MASPRAQYEIAARAAARKYKVPEGLFLSLITHESGWDPNSKSPVGAYGLTQLMPQYHAHSDVYNPIRNIDAGARELSSYFYGTGGLHPNLTHKWDIALAAYNAGAGNVNKYGGIPPFHETQAYVPRVLGDAPKYGAPPGFVGTLASKLGTGSASGASSFSAPRATAAPSAPVPGTPLQSKLAAILPFLNSTSQMIGLPQMPVGLLSQLAPSSAPSSVPSKVRPGKVVATLPAQQPGGATFPVVSEVPRLGRGAKAAITLAEQYLGTPYSWGGGGPSGPSYGTAQGSGIKGFDCSSLLQFVWGKQGISIPRTTYDQWKTGMSVPRLRLLPGDAVFFHMGSRGPEHVGMYLGNDQFIQAPHTGDVVKISKFSTYGGFVGARRFA